jgi:hypothetical protein
MTRPVSVTVVLWVIIALSLEALAGIFGPFGGAVLTAIASKHSLTVPLAFWSTAVIDLVQIALAIAMLKGASWARIAFVAIACLTCLALLMKGAFPYVTVTTFTKTAIFTWILFRADANKFFRKSAPVAAT